MATRLKNLIPPTNGSEEKKESQPNKPIVVSSSNARIMALRKEYETILSTETALLNHLQQARTRKDQITGALNELLMVQKSS